MWSVYKQKKTKYIQLNKTDLMRFTYSLRNVQHNKKCQDR